MLAKRIKLLRKQKGLTQKQLADLLDISASTVAMYETGRREPDTQTLNKFAELFGVSVDYLLGREKTDMERLEENLARLDPRIQQAYRSLQSMDEEDLAMTLELIKVIESKKKKG